MDASFNQTVRSQKDVLEDFIITYRNEPCLWNIKAKDYRDRQRKEKGYAKLIMILKAIEPAASRDQVVKKINNIRSSYRKEKKKVEQSLRSGAEGGEVYQPKLWYYHLLRFLDDLEGDNEDEYQEIYEEHLLVDTVLDNDDIAEDKHDVSSTPSVASNPQNSTLSRSHPLKRKSHYELVNYANEGMMAPYEDRFYRPPDDENDRFDIFGKLVACKLRSLPKQQQLLAEKIINETLFEAEMGFLTLSHKLVPPNNHIQQQDSLHNRNKADQS